MGRTRTEKSISPTESLNLLKKDIARLLEEVGDIEEYLVESEKIKNIEMDEGKIHKLPNGNLALEIGSLEELKALIKLNR